MTKENLISKKKCNCQFEKGHSRECPLFVEPENPMKNPTNKNWEEEFDKEINENYLRGATTGKQLIGIKQFISKLLRDERKKKLVASVPNQEVSPK
jgi:hypothetical protein